MAAKKPPSFALVDASDIDVHGRSKDARLLVAYAAQAGASALPLLERAMREGSAAVRTGAVEALARHAPELGERLVLQAAASASALGAAELAALLRSLVVIGTPRTLAAAVDLVLAWRGPALPVDKLAHANMDALLAILAARLKDIDEGAYRASLFALGLPRALGEADVDHDAQRGFVASILDDERAHPVQREDAARVLLKWRDERSLALLLGHAGMLPIDVALPVFMKRAPAEMFDALAPRVHEDSTFRERVFVALTPAADRRWVDVVRLLIDVDPRLALDALCRVGDVDTVERYARGPFDDEITRTALYMLASHRDPRAAPILRAYLERGASDDTAAVLLAALGTCGSLDDAAWLEARATDDGRTPSYKQMATLIRHRIAMSSA